MLFETKNRQLERTLKNLEKDLIEARDENDLISLIESFKKNAGQNSFDQRPFYLGLAVCFAVFICLVVFAPSDGSFLIPILISILILMKNYQLNQQITKLSERIFQKDVLKDNDLKPISVIRAAYAKELEKRFYEFDRGNYSREIKSLYRGYYQDQEHSFNIELYRFQYKDETRDSDGKTIIENDRYGIIVPFKYVKELAVSTMEIPGIYPNAKALILGMPVHVGDSAIGYVTYQPASAVFNKRYKVYAANQHQAAKFLEPAVVEAFEGISWCFDDLNFEFNRDGDLCMSFKDKDVIFPERTYGLNQPDQFIKEIKQHNQMGKLSLALMHIHTLMKYADNNFEENRDE